MPARFLVLPRHRGFDMPGRSGTGEDPIGSAGVRGARRLEPFPFTLIDDDAVIRNLTPGPACSIRPVVGRIQAIWWQHERASTRPA